MVYKKFVRKGGKLHGPYYYESYRMGDKVGKRYIGKSLPGENFGKKKVVLQLILVFVLISLLIFSFYYINYSGETEINSKITSFVTFIGKVISSYTVEDNSTPSEDVETIEVVDIGDLDNTIESGDSTGEEVDAQITSSSEQNESEEIESIVTDETLNESFDEDIESEEEILIEENDLNQTDIDSNSSIINDTLSEDTQSNITELSNIIANETETIIANETETIIANETETIIIANETIVNITGVNLSLISDIPLIRIKKGSYYELNLEEYFFGAYSYYVNMSNFTSTFDIHSLTLIPDEGFSGARKGKVIAYSEDLNTSLESNEFTILVSSGAVSIKLERS